MRVFKVGDAVKFRDGGETLVGVIVNKIDYRRFLKDYIIYEISIVTWAYDHEAALIKFKDARFWVRKHLVSAA